ncbi:hypothetical protein CU097_015563 [Rhizopus azygosporus]|uniref:non-specific serine/threonine protein kinase n=1 Tax=Rhizopus azygosporus TaxID=86630 RepID=A0A367KBL0_RHIAZ|nr:hypothetical protein CU097_015563 [Rhizopus azygosporus]
MSLFSNFVDSVTTAVDSVTLNKRSDGLIHSVIKVNQECFKLQKLLGEGGFAFVYLAQDDKKQLYAIKVIKCVSKELTENAKKEGILLSRLNHDNIIKIKDMCMIKEDDGSKMLYMIMPFYKRGSVQDLIDNNRKSGKYLEEEYIFSLFKQVCLGVKALADYRNRQGIHQPWAHRDIKPANILLSDDGKTPVLMDFGSARIARIEIDDKKMANKIQDEAAEHCSMPYRAPELFDVKVNSKIDERVDVWSLGCTLFAMAYGESPFEMTINRQGGGSIGLAT